ncbi:hypothetical protein AgCh_035705 [Apium graveolens]
MTPEVRELTECENVNRITEEQNAQIMKPVTMEEVKDAVFSTHLEKSPGIDGLNPGFYQEVNAPCNYLSLPMHIGRRKTEVFKGVNVRVKNKLQGWSNKSISKAVKVCDEIHRQMNRFWWGHGGSGKGAKWCSWEIMCVTKEAGGLGFKNLKKINISMLEKQGWRLLNNENQLVTSIIKARYLPKCDFLDAKLGVNPSFMWRSILATHESIRQGCRKRIGNGHDIFAWKVAWLPCKDNGYLTTNMPQELENISVRSLIEENARNWDREILQDIFNARDRELIPKIPLHGEHSMPHKDFWKKVWTLNLPGKTEAKLQGDLQVMQGDTVFKVLKRVLTNSSKEKVVRIVMLCWGLRNRRNKWTWEKTNMSPFSVQAQAKNMLDGWREAVKDKQKHGPGRFLRARGRQFAAEFLPIEAEALSLNEALSWAIEAGYSKCVFESDVKMLVDAYQGSNGRNYLHAIVSDCTDLFKHFVDVLVQFVHRSANGVAHVLARATHFMSDTHEWMNTAPEFMLDALKFDSI